MSKRKLLILWVILLLCVCFVCGCQGGEGEVITSYAQLDGKTVGNAEDAALPRLLRGAEGIDFETYQFKTYMEPIIALQSGKIDAFIITKTYGEFFLEEYPDLALLQPFTTIDWTFVAPLSQKALVAEADVVIKRMYEDGTIERVFNKWMDEDETNDVLEEVEFTGERGTLTAAITAEFPGYCYILDGEVVGSDIDIGRMVFSELGYNLEYLQMPFDALIAAATTEKCDVVMTDLYKTDERANSVVYFDRIYETPLTVLVRGGAVNGGGISFWDQLKTSFEKTFVTEARWKLVLQGICTTLAISLLAMVFGTLLGAGVCGMARSKLKILRGIAKTYVVIMQGMPILLVLMVLYYIVFNKVSIQPITVAVIGFALDFGAHTSVMFETGIDAVDTGQLEAAQASGFHKASAFALIVIPQAVRHILPVYKGEFISMVKMTSVVGYIAIQDLTKMTDIIRSLTFEAFFPLIVASIIYFLITYVFIFILERIRIKMDPEKRARRIKGVNLHDKHSEFV